MQEAYKTAVVYFLLFSLMLLLSGFMLFKEKIGFDIESVTQYYLGNAKEFINAKTVGGIFKVILPHIFVFGLFTMVVLHFLVFTKLKQTKHFQYLIVLSFTLALTELFSPFLILQGLEIFSYVKLFSFFALEVLFLYLFYLLFRSIIQE